MISVNRKILTTAWRSLSIAAVFAAAVTPASAIMINTGNPDLSLNVDATVKYNLAWRLEDVNPHFVNAFGYDEVETNFDKGDLIKNRFDILIDADLTWKNVHGVRVSAAAWYENAYGNRSHTNPAIGAALGPYAPGSNQGPDGTGTWTDYADKYITGHSAEILDAFAFTSINIGETTLALKAGQLNQYYGDSMFSNADAIANSQSPIDAIKGQSTPGSEARELFLPLTQISMEWQINNNLVLVGQYLLDWEPFRVSAGGTYWASGDSTGDLGNSQPMCAAVFPGGMCLGYGDPWLPDDSGDFGIGFRVTPKWFIDQSGQGQIGVYYRRYAEKLPWSFTELDFSGFDFLNPAASVRLSFARDTELFGISVLKNINPWGLGFEISHRMDTALNSVNGAQVSNLDFSTFQFKNLGYGDFEGARGDTWHALINGVLLLPRTPIWETGTLTAELAYQRLGKVTKNEHLYIGEGYAGCPEGRTDKSGCASRDSLLLNVNFGPAWTAVLPGIDITLPMTLSYNVFGTSATLGGTSEGAYNWSVGAEFLYHRVYYLTLKYADSHQDYWTKTVVPDARGSFDGIPGSTIISHASGASSIANNHGYISLTFKTTF